MVAGKAMENPLNGDSKKQDPEPPPTSGIDHRTNGEAASAQAIKEVENSNPEISNCADDDNNNESDQLRKLKLASSNKLNRSKRSVRWNKELVSTESPRMIAARMAASASSNGGGSERSNLSSSSSSSSPSPAQPTYTETFISTISSVGIALLRWGNNVKDATKKAEDLAGNTWQHLKTSPSVTDAALGRIAQGAKVLAEGGYDKIFRQTFETTPDEELHNSFVCYLSTSAGPVMGVLYLSTSKLAYCSDTPMPFKSSSSSPSSSSSSNSNTVDTNSINTQWSYYKVIIPLEQLKSVSPSSNGNNRAEKYIQILSTDNHEFWYMGFVNYEAAVISLQTALYSRHMTV